MQNEERASGKGEGSVLFLFALFFSGGRAEEKKGMRGERSVDLPRLCLWKTPCLQDVARSCELFFENV